MPNSKQKTILLVSCGVCAGCTILLVLYVLYRVLVPSDEAVKYAVSVALGVASLAGAVAVLMYTDRLTVRSAGIVALHFGMLFFFVGVLIFCLFGAKYDVEMTPSRENSYSEIHFMDKDNSYTLVSLPFEMSLDSFEVVTYPNGADKEYNAVLTFTQKRSRLANSVDISVNKPVRKNGYKLYLMGYTKLSDSYRVNMLIKRDPGEYISLIGIVFMVAGSFACAFAKGKRKRSPHGIGGESK